MENEHFNRRQMMGGLAAASALTAAPATSEVPHRTLGRTGEKVSAVGLGGFHLGEATLTDKDAIRLMHQALDRGMNFLDNCWDYNDGKSEIRMGEALQGGYRQKAFVMTKFDGRGRATAEKQIDESLRRLRTDRIDLLQYHEVIRFDDVDRFFAVGGGAEALLAAREKGKARYIGFTGHKDPRIHLYMLESAARQGFRWDAVQMPLNVMDAHYRSFEKLVLPELIRQEIGVLGMKSLGGGVIPKSKTASPIECLRYALHLPITTVITGINSDQLLDQAIKAAAAPKLTDAEVTAILARTQSAASAGKFELFKTTSHFDGTGRHPEWMGPESAAVQELTLNT